MSTPVRRFSGRGLRSLLLSALGGLVASSAGAFEETFDRDTVIEEAPRAAVSRNPRWWVSAGGRVTFAEGTAYTIQGSLPPWDPWARAYARTKPVDTEQGRRPQNVFRMVTRETGRTFRQRVSVRIRSTNLAASTERGPFSGIFLESRFLNDNNFYVAGLRFDGQAVIKKRREAEAFTVAIAPVYPGTYDRQSNPNLLPQNRWFSIRSTIHDVPGGVRILLEIHDPALGPDWIPVLDVLDGPGGADGRPVVGAGSAGIRTDFMDVQLDDYLVFEPVDVLPDRPGVYDPSTAAVALQVVPTPGAPPAAFTFGPASDLRPFAGRFDAGACSHQVGLYDPGSGFFAIAGGAVSGPAATEFRFGPAGGELLPIAGDWDGDGIDGIGLYDPSTGTFFLSNGLDGGTADAVFTFGSGGGRFLPIAGDWDGDGVDGVGIYDPARGVFFLRDVLAGGVADYAFTFGPAGAALLPVAGDWEGDGTDGIGVFRADDGLFALLNVLGPGSAERVDRMPGSSPFALPLAGRWEEGCR
jgi:hypothetical protein